jgi:hypothetical protein
VADASEWAMICFSWLMLFVFGGLVLHVLTRDEDDEPTGNY